MEKSAFVLISISVTKEMQQEGARLKLLSVLKVAEKKPLTNEAPKVDICLL